MVAVNEFRKAANRYAGYHAHAANKNGDTYLTKAEAAKLPKDLQDNFAEIQRGDSNRQVTMAEFKEAWVAKVASSSVLADRNDDGFLTRAENRNLPNSLRDNLANYMNKVEASGAKSERALQTALATALTTKDWEGFKKLCNPANVEAQSSLGIKSEQYVLEAIGLGYVDGPFSDLSASEVVNNIASVTFSRAATRGPVQEPGDSAFEAKVTLKNGRSATVVIPVGTVGAQMMITPAYG